MIDHIIFQLTNIISILKSLLLKKQRILTVETTYTIFYISIFKVKNVLEEDIPKIDALSVLRGRG
jgi:hypothetical protein